jgi:hypothetical protein
MWHDEHSIPDVEAQDHLRDSRSPEIEEKRDEVQIAFDHLQEIKRQQFHAAKQILAEKVGNIERFYPDQRERIHFFFLIVPIFALFFTALEYIISTFDIIRGTSATVFHIVYGSFTFILGMIFVICTWTEKLKTYSSVDKLIPNHATPSCTNWLFETFGISIAPYDHIYARKYGMKAIRRIVEVYYPGEKVSDAEMIDKFKNLNLNFEGDDPWTILSNNNIPQDSRT